MNRVIVCGVAVFFAIAAIAMLGNDNTAVAGHGCSGCDGGSDCGGEVSCGGRAHRCGLLQRLHRRRCEGRRHGCHAEAACCTPAPSCCGEAHVEVHAAPVEEAAPAAPAAAEPAPAAPAAAAPAGEARFVVPARVRFVRFRR